MELKQYHFFKGNIGSEMLKMGHISPLIVGCHAACTCEPFGCSVLYYHFSTVMLLL